MMARLHSRHGARVAIACLLVGLLALSGGACGDADSGGDPSPATGQTDDGDTYTGVQLPPRLKGSGRTGERAAAAEVVLDVQEGFAIKSGLSVCIELSHAAEERVIRSATGASRSCEKIVEEATDRWHAAGEDPVVSEVGRVRVDGREAAVTVSHPDGGEYQVRVVKGRDWKLPTLDLERPPGLVPMQ